MDDFLEILATRIPSPGAESSTIRSAVGSQILITYLGQSKSQRTIIYGVEVDIFVATRLQSTIFSLPTEGWEIKHKLSTYCPYPFLPCSDFHFKLNRTPSLPNLYLFL
jgi:hypothetical protein